MEDRLTALPAILKTRKPVAMRAACGGTCFSRNALSDVDAESEVAVRTFPVRDVGRSSEAEDWAVRPYAPEATLVLPAANGRLEGGNWDLDGLVVDINTVPCSAEGRSIAGAGHVTFTEVGASTWTVDGIVTVYDQALRAEI